MKSTTVQVYEPTKKELLEVMNILAEYLSPKYVLQSQPPINLKVRGRRKSTTKKP